VGEVSAQGLRQGCQTLVCPHNTIAQTAAAAAGRHTHWHPHPHPATAWQQPMKSPDRKRAEDTFKLEKKEEASRTSQAQHSQQQTKAKRRKPPPRKPHSHPLPHHAHNAPLRHLASHRTTHSQRQRCPPHTRKRRRQRQRQGRRASHRRRKREGERKNVRRKLARSRPRPPLCRLCRSTCPYPHQQHHHHHRHHRPLLLLHTTRRARPAQPQPQQPPPPLPLPPRRLHTNLRRKRRGKKHGDYKKFQKRNIPINLPAWQKFVPPNYRKAAKATRHADGWPPESETLVRAEERDAFGTTESFDWKKYMGGGSGGT